MPHTPQHTPKDFSKELEKLLGRRIDPASRLPGARSRPSVQQSPSALQPSPSSPYGAKIYLNRQNGDITTNLYNRGQYDDERGTGRRESNIPLYYDAQNNFLTPNKTSIVARFGSGAQLDPQVGSMIDALKAQQEKAAVEFQAEQEAATEQMNQTYGTSDAPAFQIPKSGSPYDGPLPALDQIERSKYRAEVRKLSELYLSNRFSTPAGQLEAEAILAEIKLYSPPEVFTVGVLDREGRQVEIPLPSSADKNAWAKFRDNIIVSFIEMTRGGGANPLMQIWRQGVRQGIGSPTEQKRLEIQTQVAQFTGPNIMTLMDSLNNSIREFHDSALDRSAVYNVGFTALSTIPDMLPGVSQGFTRLREFFDPGPGNIIEKFERLTQRGPQSGSIGDKVKALFSDASHADRMGAELAEDPGLIVGGIRTVFGGSLRAITDIGAIISGNDYGYLNTATVFGIPLHELMTDLTPELQARRNRRLDNLQRAAQRLTRSDFFLDVLAGGDTQAQDTFAEWLGAAEDAGERPALHKLPESIKEELGLDEDFILDLTTEAEFNKVLAGEIESNEPLIEQAFLALNAAESINDTELASKARLALYDASFKVWHAIKARTDMGSSSWRYTWAWSEEGEDLEQLADQAIIMAMVQKGRVLEGWEIREVTQRFTDAGAEFAGEVIFDYLNLIPGQVIGEIFRGIKGIPRALLEVTSVSRRGLGWLDRTLLSSAIMSRGTRISAQVSGVAQRLGRTIGFENVDEFTAGVVELSKALADETGQLLASAAKKFKITDRQLISLMSYLEDIGPSVTLEEILAKALKKLSRVPDAQITVRNIGDAMFDTARGLFLGNDKNTLKGFEFLKPGQIMDEGLIAKFLKAEGTISTTPNQLIAGFWKFQEMYRKIWIQLVLVARPGYTVINHLDNAFRAVLHGANPFLDMKSIINRHDIWPDNVRGGFGRSITGASPGNLIIEGQVNPTLRNMFAYGFSNPPPTGTGLPGTTGIRRLWAQFINGMAYVNGSSEFMWRARLYDKMVMQDSVRVLGLIQDFSKAQLQAAGVVDPGVFQILEQAFAQGGRNPAKVAALITGESGVYSMLIPPEAVAKWADLVSPHAVDSYIQTSVRKLTTMVENGNLTKQNIGLMFDSLMDEIAAQVDATMEAAYRTGRARVGAIDPSLASGEAMSADELLNLDNVQPDISPSFRDTVPELEEMGFNRELSEAWVDAQRAVGVDTQVALDRGIDSQIRAQKATTEQAVENLRQILDKNDTTFDDMELFIANRQLEREQAAALVDVRPDDEILDGIALDASVEGEDSLDIAERNFVDSAEEWATESMPNEVEDLKALEADLANISDVGDDIPLHQQAAETSEIISDNLNL